jgi:hypothetical protein
MEVNASEDVGAAFQPRFLQSSTAAVLSDCPDEGTPPHPGPLSKLAEKNLLDARLQDCVAIYKNA